MTGPSRGPKTQSMKDPATVYNTLSYFSYTHVSYAFLVKTALNWLAGVWPFPQFWIRALGILNFSKPSNYGDNTAL